MKIGEIETSSEEKALLFLKKYCKELIVVAAAVPVALFVKQSFEDTRIKALDDSVALFSKVREEQSAIDQKLDQILSLKVSDKEDDKKKLVDLQGDVTKESEKLTASLQALLDTREPYPELGKLYQRIVNKAEGSTELESLQHVVDAPESTRLLKEGELLVAARRNLDNGDDKVRAGALEALNNLATRGKYFSVLAAAIYARVAEQPAEKAAAHAVMQRLLAEQPVHTETLKEDLARVAP